MKVRSTILALAALLTAAVFASTASAAKPILITGKYAGQASTQVNGDVATISAQGNGTASVLGAGSLSGQGTGDASQQPCVPFAGTGTITGTAGTKITYKVLTGASGCGDEGGHVFSFKGQMQVVKATGKLAKAKGLIKFTGVYDRDGGTFTAKLTGTLKK